MGIAAPMRRAARLPSALRGRGFAPGSPAATWSRSSAAPLRAHTMARTPPAR